MTNDRFALLTQLMEHYKASYPDDAVVMVSAEQEEDDPESIITMIGNIPPADIRALLTAAVDESEEPGPTAFEHVPASMTRH